MYPDAAYCILVWQSLSNRRMFAVGSSLVINLRPLYPRIGTIWSYIVSIRFLQLVAMLSFVFCVFKFAGWWFGTWILFFHMLGMSSSQLTNSMIFQRGRSTTNQITMLSQCHGLPQRETAAHGSAAGRVRQQPLDVDDGFWARLPYAKMDMLWYVYESGDFDLFNQKI